MHMVNLWIKVVFLIIDTTILMSLADIGVGIDISSVINLLFKFQLHGLLHGRVR